MRLGLIGACQYVAAQTSCAWLCRACVHACTTLPPVIGWRMPLTAWVIVPADASWPWCTGQLRVPDRADGAAGGPLPHAHPPAHRRARRVHGFPPAHACLQVRSHRTASARSLRESPACCAWVCMRLRVHVPVRSAHKHTAAGLLCMRLGQTGNHAQRCGSSPDAGLVFMTVTYSLCGRASRVVAVVGAGHIPGSTLVFPHTHTAQHVNLRLLLLASSASPETSSLHEMTKQCGASSH